MTSPATTQLLPATMEEVTWLGAALVHAGPF
jgi:hypothetical protein